MTVSLYERPSVRKALRSAVSRSCASVSCSGLIALDGKLRGSRARQLGDLLSEMPRRRDPVNRLVLDLRSVVTIDSLGTQAIEDAREANAKLAYRQHRRLTRPKLRRDNCVRSSGSPGNRISASGV